MTQRIFKKSCKQDMEYIFNHLPKWVDYITCFCKDDPIFSNGQFYFFCSIQFPKFKFCVDKEMYVPIDFETDKIEEMIIERPKEDNDK